MIASLPPGWLLAIGALLIPVLRGRLKQAYLLLLPVLSFLHLLMVSAATDVEHHLALFNLALEPVRLDELSLVFGYIFHLAAFLGVIFSIRIRDDTQHVSAMFYVGSCLGAVFAGDLLTLFVYWELAAIASVFLIWARRSERSFRAGLRYLLIQVGSGVLLLAGILIHYHETSSLAFDKFSLESPGISLIFLAFGIKCAFPLLHNWLTDAYPESTATGAVFLSAFTTKLAVYALARGFPGEEMLIPIGAAMAAFPIFFAVIENDLRRVLTYSMINQLGFMVVGIGIGTELALNGTVAHAFAHILYKALLFMSMGAVLLRTGTVDGSELGGLYKSMPWTAAFCMVGAASISAFPLFSGFVSKSLIVSATAGEHHTVVYFLLLFASAGVLHHAGIKIPYFAFFAHDSGIRCREAPLNMRVAMGLSAALCIGIGVYPHLLYRILPFVVQYEPYTTAHVFMQLQLLFWAALAFAVLNWHGIDPPELRSVNLDSEWIYRRALPAIALGTRRMVSCFWGGLLGSLQTRIVRTIETVHRYHGPQGVLERTWPTGSMALWVAIMLGAVLLLYYI